MTIKTKISLALTFLFSIIILLGGLGAFYLNRLSNDAQEILKDNYISLEYVSSMQKALATRHSDPDALQIFDENLRKQAQNITEQGEQETTEALRRNFTYFRKHPTDTTSLNRLQEHLLIINDINRQAMFRKNTVAEQTARDALIWLVTVGTFCVLIVFSFIINFPGYIANPLRELTRGIREITSRNFEERLHFKSDDEFGELARSFNSMAQKLDEYEHSNLARILFEKKRIETLIQVMSDGIIGLDQNRYILFVNTVASRLLGLKERDLVGKYAPDVASVNDLMRSLIHEIMASNDQPLMPSTESNLLKIYDTDANGQGKENYFAKQIQTVDVTRTGDQKSVRAGYVIVLKNITSFKELDLAKTNFIATVSHELKTPIAGIKMSLKLLDDQRVGELNGEQKQLIQHVREDADRLLNITGELLNMAQVESGQIQLQLHNVAPSAIVNYATNALRTAAEQKQIRLVVSIPDKLPEIKADPDKTSWVLINFLSNAIRHSPDENHIDVTVSQLEKSVEFRVRDFGAGIRPEHRDRIFDRYFSAPGTNGQASGTGLGLAISKEFIQSMNGSIGLDTSLITGAAFYFRLPISET